jgi:hypothetical protein
MWDIGGQSGAGAGFLLALPVPLSILISSTVSHSSSIIWGWYNRPVVADSVSPHPKQLKKS